ncbi:MAG: polyprenyl synthetase family protein [Phycisphaerales bacterium]|nr:MAG: polyprenyl synthetase family protein [Phycisphaerales bacterium]
MNQTVSETLKDYARRFDVRLAEFLPADDGASDLAQAVRYSALAPGKRLRPYLVSQCCTIAGGDVEQSYPAAAAIECVHVFSLIHDDLPAMDDDDLRRGQPTCHRRFSEATAILAGDALLTLAFELLVRHAQDAGLAVRLVREVSEAVGIGGMIGGQAADIAGQRRPASLERVRDIHARKTARLIEASCRVGAMIGASTGAAQRPNIMQTLAEYGRWLGSAFQITDDVLDVTATREAMGKAVRKDAAVGKQTYPACVGVEESRRAAREACARAVDALTALGPEADDLRALAGFVLERAG